MKKRVENKRGQIKLSFGMIFSIILIVFFIAFAFFGIKKFLAIQNDIKIGQFKNDFQSDIDKMWKSYQGSQEVNYLIPNKIESVCIQEDEFEEIKFYPVGIYKGFKIEHVNFDETIPSGKEDICFENKNGKVSMVLKKSYGENLVIISHS